MSRNESEDESLSPIHVPKPSLFAPSPENAKDKQDETNPNSTPTSKESKGNNANESETKKERKEEKKSDENEEKSEREQSLSGIICSSFYTAHYIISPFVVFKTYVSSSKRILAFALQFNALIWLTALFFYYSNVIQNTFILLQHFLHHFFYFYVFLIFFVGL